MTISHGFNADDFGVGHFSTFDQNVFVSLGQYLSTPILNNY